MSVSETRLPQIHERFLHRGLPLVLFTAGFTVRTGVDPLYRRRYFEPLIADMAVSLAGRDAYLELERP